MIIFSDNRRSERVKPTHVRVSKDRAKVTKVDNQRGRGFIMDEADMSGEASTDESEDDLDQMDDSFVNDATQLSQETGNA